MESTAREAIYRLYPDEFLEPPKKKNFWKKHRSIVILLSVPLALVILMNVYYYNVFINLQQNIFALEADIGAQVQRRNNLITYLVAIVKDYKGYEKDIFIHLGDARNMLLKHRALIESDSAAPDEAMRKSLNEALAQLMAIAERYPDLKATDTFQKLMAELAATEAKIAETRSKYNDEVNKFTTQAAMFPGNIFAFVLRVRTDIGFFRSQNTAEKIPAMEFK
ncbi:MAG: LemA family protein [bacterium]